MDDIEGEAVTLFNRGAGDCARGDKSRRRDAASSFERMSHEDVRDCVSASQVEGVTSTVRRGSPRAWSRGNASAGRRNVSLSPPPMARSSARDRSTAASLDVKVAPITDPSA